MQLQFLSSAYQGNNANHTVSDDFHNIKRQTYTEKSERTPPQSVFHITTLVETS